MPGEDQPADPTSMFAFELSKPDGVRSPESMTPLRLMHEFTSHLHAFDQYWQILSPEPWQTMDAGQAGPWRLVGWQGGGFNLRQAEFHLTGHAALIGPRCFLSSRSGIAWRQDAPQDEDPAENGDNRATTHISGSGGIKAWLCSPESEVTWIQSENFEHVADHSQVVQFQGGAVRLSNKGCVLEAGEEWQFVRVFSGTRLVLSPGAWKMLDPATGSSR
jgi:hypothetical protein